MEFSDLTWRKSSYSGSQTSCVEFAVWHMASHSGSNGDCVELSAAERVVAVRDSKDRGGQGLSFSPAAWQEFTGQGMAGAFDPA
jgi:Domain of unknown function (DUF397)